MARCESLAQRTARRRAMLPWKGGMLLTGLFTLLSFTTVFGPLSLSGRKAHRSAAAAGAGAARRLSNATEATTATQNSSSTQAPAASVDDEAPAALGEPNVIADAWPVEGINLPMLNATDTFVEETCGPFAGFAFALGLVYMFFALYIVCDEFFVPSLDFMSAKMGLSPDVAGATLMAAGGSAPEFFTSFFASLSPVPSSVGIAAIVGSAVFNVLFVIGACGIAAPSSTGLKLTWYPLARDSLFYIIDLAVMAVAFMDNKIEMWEAGLLFGLYLLYCFYMKVSAQVEEKLTGKKPGEDEPEDEASKQLKALDKDGDGLLTKAEVEGTELRKAFTKIDEDGDGKITLKELRRFKIKSTRNWDSPDEVPEDNRPLSLCIEDDGDPNVFHQLRVKSYWVLTLPIIFVLILTVPDCRRPGSERCYFLGFVGSIVWIAAFSYIMVHCTEMVGLATGVPKEILALTFVAWGTSIPDLVTSVLVTVQGHGDMAVSSSIGSNIFDVTVGLPIPWLIFMAINGGSFPVGSEGLFLNILMLVGMIFVTVVSIMANKWVLNRILGFMMLVLWSGFTIYSVVSAS